MNKTFRVLYFFNVAIIIIALLSPIAELLFFSSSADLSLQYFAVLILLSITFCVTFFILNTYGALKYPLYRTRFLIIALLLCAWIILGIYQILYFYLNDISL